MVLLDIESRPCKVQTGHCLIVLILNIACSLINTTLLFSRTHSTKQRVPLLRKTFYKVKNSTNMQSSTASCAYFYTHFYQNDVSINCAIFWRCIVHVLKLQNKACQSEMLKILNNPCIIRGIVSLTSHNS